MTPVFPLTALEIASGFVLGRDEEAPGLPEVDPTVSPLEALGKAILPALARPPCLVSFSGGRDSSAVLAVAALVSRREGLDLPVPVTLRFRGVPETDESAWQELVVRHLDLPAWIRRELADELDFIGPVAQHVLLGHGLLWPPNAHFQLPVLGEARGGSVLTGLDGDGLFGDWRCVRAAAVLARRARPVPRDLLSIGLAVAPAAVRAAWLRARHPLGLRWLREAALEAVERDYANETAHEPLRWNERVGVWARSRYISALRASLEVLADAAGALMIHPFLDARFLGAVARAGGRLGFGERTRAMQALFGELLPSPLLERATKASFDGVFWSSHFRAFVADWAGGGAPADIVDERELHAEWCARVPHAASATLLQTIWLASAASQPTGGAKAGMFFPIRPGSVNLKPDG